MAQAYTIEELIDVVQGELTISQALPKLLPNLEIRRLIENKCMPWFYQNYQFAVQKMYFFVDRAFLESEEWTQYKYIDMPCEIQTIVWLYEMHDTSLFQLGINAPNLSINMGVTNQPYISSYVTTIGELGTYKTILDSFSDMMDQLSKFTVKYNYNQMNNRLNILTNVKHHLVAECYANIPAEHLYSDPMFITYVTGMAKQQLGNLMTRYNFNLPGGIQYNGDAILSEGKDDIQNITDQIKGQSNSGWFFLVKR